MSKLQKSILSLFFSSALLLSACSQSGTLGDLSATNSGKITPLEDLSHDWGDVNIEGGTVNYTFNFKNDGDKNLVIKTANTSCMCTTATVKLANGSASPSFGMVGMNSAGPWGGVVKPGEEFKMEVVFDPLAHGPDAVGPITRSIFLVTSSTTNGDYAKIDPRSGEMTTEITLSGNVLKKSQYEAKHGNRDLFSFKEKEHDFGIVKQSGGPVSYTFPFQYLGDQPLAVTSVPTSCGCTTAKVSQNNFKKGDSATVTVTFDPDFHQEPEGKFFKTATLLTDPALPNPPEVKIWAQVNLDLGSKAYKFQGGDKD